MSNINLRKPKKRSVNISINKKMFNDAYLELYTRDTPVQIIFGSASAGKSYSIMHWVVLWALNGRNIIVARKHQNQLRRTVFSEITKAISNLELDKYFEINKTNLTITSNIGCGAIVFVGVDDNSKLKSLTAPTLGGTLDTLVMEESDAFTEDDFDQLRTRMRGISKFPKKTLMIFNPVSKLRMQWVWDRFFEPADWDDEVDEVYEDDTLYIKRCSYTMNKFLDSFEKANIEDARLRNPRFYRVYGLGRFGMTGKMVFDGNFKHEDFNIHEMMRKRNLTLHIGGDFGYIHKSAVVFSMYDRINRKIYVFGEIGVRGKTKTQLADIVKAKIHALGVNPNQVIYFDSAEPASIKELQMNRISATAAKKGPDSLRRSIDFIQSNEIIIHPSCPQLYSEMETLTYKKSANGEYDERIDDSSGDDLIAALRYGYSNDYMVTGGVFGAKVKY